ncbi:inner nuclear membrane protein Man1 isoform X2 [Anopheles aquasalis]|uniref:inner nuclear membrane protein Man1 isoform X2 n=1 Tax=Anopheles aquasalis TaxID=42839 RepID=UPI00215AF0FF|nr:inner nuclear membrane protein Man1 isoform X2 [Anopheles aquasalis]
MSSNSYRLDALDQLSDDELRLQLVQYGFPTMPVTSTTRNILIKKLRHHLEEEKRKVRRESSQAARYSSGEESDGTDGRKLGGSASARKTFGRSSRVTSMAAPPAPAPAAAAAATAAQHSLSNHGSSPFLAANGGGNSSGGGGGGGAKKGSLSPSSIYISPVIVHDGDEDDFASSTLRNPPRAFGSTSSPSYQSSLFRQTALAAQNVTPPSMAANNSDSNGSNGSGGSGGDSSPPYVSDYTKRLMQLRGETVSQENYNSAIGGIISRRSSSALGGGGGGGGVGIGSSRYTIGPPTASNSSSHPLHHPSRVPVHPLHYRSSTGTGGSSSSNTGSFKPLGGMPSALVSGNHIRQRYSRLMHGGQAAEVDENDIVTHAQPSPEPPTASGVPLRVAFGNLLTRLDEHYGFKQTFVPCALLCLLVAFLVSVALMYMTISTDLASTLSSIDTRYDVCDWSSELGIGEGDPHAAPAPESGTTCVDESDVLPALELLKLIGEELKQRVEAYHCRRGDVDRAIGMTTKLPLAASLMSPTDVLKLAKENSPSVLIPQLTRHLHALEYLIDRNPQWRIDHTDADGQPLTFTEVLERRPTKAHYFTILRPKLPFGCMLYNKFQKFFTIVGGLALATVLGFLARYFYRFVVYVKQKRRDQVNALVSEMIHAVSQAAANAAEATSLANGGASTVPIPDARVVVAHLRDRLIPIESRRKMSWAWNEALQFLENNESRISFEVGTVGGEDFKMMRWIDTAPLPSSIGASSSLATTPGGRASAGGTGAGTGGGGGGGGSSAATGLGGVGSSSKKWQGQAFDSSNKIHDPPTPCLKIRQMFDRYEVNDPNLKTIVQDAILEKVGDRCRIYDIQLDRGSCCVYVRCATPKDAGIVHDEINGWWFDNRLVSIKFLRLERYQQRFPRSLAGPACLKPSNKSNSSMSHQLGAAAGANGGRSGSVSRSVHEDDESEPEEEDEMAEELVVMPTARSGTPTREDFLRQLKQRQHSTNTTPTQSPLRRIPAPRLDDLDQQDD